MHKVIEKIDGRIEIAANGQRDIDMWDCADDNLGAPDGLSYNDWVYQAMQEASDYIESLEAKLRGNDTE